MSGRFFKHVSDSESESSDTDSEIQPQRAVPNITATYFSDEEEEAKRVVRTAKEKRYEELFTIIKQIRNHKKIKDISKLLTAFENLTKAFQKAKNVIDKEEAGVTPRFYVRCLVEMDDFIAELWEDREGRKSMNKQNSKSLTTLRQKLRKYIKDFEADITTFREAPDEGEDEDEESENEESESSGDEGAGTRFVQKATKAKDLEKSDGDDEDAPEKEKASKFHKGTASGSDSDSEDWGSSSEESESSSDDDKYTNIADKFLKKGDGVGRDRERRGKREKKKREGKKQDDDEGEGGWEQVKGGTVVVEKPKMFGKDEEVNHQSMLKKLNEVLAMRGKKRIHRTDQMDMLSDLLSISEDHKLGPAMEAKIMYGIVGGLFDYNPNVSSCMKSDMWVKCLDFSNRLLDTLIGNPDIAISENIAEESESYETSPYRVHGCALTLVERMDEEFTKMLQSVDAHSPDYIERLKDENKVCQIIVRLQTYLETDQRGTSSETCRVYKLRIDHLYFKFDPHVLKVKEQMAKEAEEAEALLNGGFTKLEMVIEDKKEGEEKEKETTEEKKPEKKDDEKAADEEKAKEVEEGKVDDKATPQESTESSVAVMDRLCKFIYAKDTTDRIRTEAILCHIYHHALHDNWFEARDLMLMSHLQHNINKSDIPLQIIYNRALVQLGLCAFRHGNIKDAHTALLDIQIQGRAKELLAQGLLPRQQERTPEQEKLEKRRLLPFHKHINLELLECVYLVSAMLLEIPDVAANEYSIRKKMISRSFYNQLRKNEEQPLVGLPESMREHVVAASKAMRVGNWKGCRDFIINEKMNSKVWNLFHQADKVRDMLVQKIREESLRAYLFTYSHVYDSISLEVLSKMLDLEKATVHSIISKMTTNEELMTSLDEPTQTLVMHRTEPSRIQGLALQLADKVNILVEQNERIWELKQMGSFGGNQRFGGRDGQGGYRDYGHVNRSWSDRLTYNDRPARGEQRRTTTHFTRNN